MNNINKVVNVINAVLQQWVRSSPGRAPDLHSGGSEFDSRRIHQIVYNHSVIKYKIGGRAMLQYRYDTQLLIEGQGLDEDEITDWILENMKGDSLICVGDDEMIKIHFHTNEPWDLLSHCATLGEIFDIVVEDMDRQSRGLKG